MNDTMARPLHNRPQAGAPAANQFGVFTVSYATEKQTRFIKSLMDRKNLANFPGDAAELSRQVAANQVNKTAASAIIDALLEMPDLEGGPTAPQGHPASEKQIAFLTRLIGERDLSGLSESDRRKINFVTRGGHPTSAGTSTLIDVLLEAPMSESAAELKKGEIHVVDGSYVRVHISQGSGMPYACVAEILREAIWADGKVVEPGEVEWTFVSGLVTKLSTATRATAEQAKGFATLAGRCIFCSHAIDTPESTAVGYGPVCAAKNNLPWGDTTEVVAQTDV